MELLLLEVNLLLEDEWERFTVTFSIYYPIKDDEYMRINGSIEKLGLWNKGEGPVAMTQGEERAWLTG
jgi:hypothetical protein